MALAIFTVRLRGHYLAIASLGFAVIVHQVLLNWIGLTQGPLGIYAIKPPPAIALPGLPIVSFGNAANMLYLVAGFALLFYLLLDALVRSPIGETLTAIREDEVSAASFGINCAAWKVFAFGIGAAVAGAAGAFYASFVGTLVPDAFIITESFTILAMVIVGGMGTLIGPVCGAILLTILPELLRGIRRSSSRPLRCGAHPHRAVHARRNGASRTRPAQSHWPTALPCRKGATRWRTRSSVPLGRGASCQGPAQAVRRRAGGARHFARHSRMAACLRSSGRTAPASRRCST